ncbi:hypothetical protein ACFFJ4_02910 [Xanthomonas dyei]|uniref:hypothetical protein n=1 Tax=Xanthomonas dyei TaxID=743699 RepID=UPI0011B0D6F9|nr:hypothetical protein [Xanthomonas dyei]
MPDDQLTIESLRRWSQIFLWVSVILPVLGGLAAGARYYVERREKQISSRISTASIQSAQIEAFAARKELGEFKQQAAPRRLSDQQRAKIINTIQLKGLPIVVACRMMDGESCDFASDLVAAFTQAGSVVPDLVKTSLNDLPGYVAVSYTGEGNSAQIESVVDVLIASGIDARLEAVKQNSIGGWRSGAFYVIVGRKLP